MTLNYGISFINEEVLKTVIKDEAVTFKCPDITSGSLTFKICPRIGESIRYPLLKTFDKAFGNWLHDNVLLEVVDIIHNPVGLIDDYVNTDYLFDIMLIVKAKLDVEI